MIGLHSSDDALPHDESGGHVLQEAIDQSYYDELIPIAGDVGMRWARELAAKEGIFTGVSGGSTFGIAMQIAGRAEAPIQYSTVSAGRSATIAFSKAKRRPPLTVSPRSRRWTSPNDSSKAEVRRLISAPMAAN